MTAVIINIIALGAFAVAFSRNRQKALKSIKVALKMFLGIMPMLIIIILLIGLLFGFVSEEGLKQFVGEQSGPLGVLLVTITGAVLHIPALLAFPLSACKGGFDYDHCHLYYQSHHDRGGDPAA